MDSVPSWVNDSWLRNAKYPDIQQVAKSLKIKANQKRDDLVNKIMNRMNEIHIQQDDPPSAPPTKSDSDGSQSPGPDSLVSNDASPNLHQSLLSNDESPPKARAHDEPQPPTDAAHSAEDSLNTTYTISDMSKQEADLAVQSNPQPDEATKIEILNILEKNAAERKASKAMIPKILKEIVNKPPEVVEKPNTKIVRPLTRAGADKSESIDDYLNRKRTRMANLLNSAQKVSERLVQPTAATRSHQKSPKADQSSATRSGSNVVKPSAPVKTPKAKVVHPKRSLDFNTTTTPKSGRKEFKLEDSLKKDLSYRPHVGKLKSFQFDSTSVFTPKTLKQTSVLQRHAKVEQERQKIKTTRAVERKDKRSLLVSSKRNM